MGSLPLGGDCLVCGEKGEGRIARVVVSLANIYVQRAMAYERVVCPALKELTNLVCTRIQRPHRDGARPLFESSAEVWVSSGLLQGQGLWVQLPGSCSL